MRHICHNCRNSVQLSLLRHLDEYICMYVRTYVCMYIHTHTYCLTYFSAAVLRTCTHKHAYTLPRVCLSC